MSSTIFYHTQSLRACPRISSGCPLRISSGCPLRISSGGSISSGMSLFLSGFRSLCRQSLRYVLVIVWVAENGLMIYMFWYLYITYSILSFSYSLLFNRSIAFFLLFFRPGCFALFYAVFASEFWFLGDCPRIIKRISSDMFMAHISI